MRERRAGRALAQRFLRASSTMSFMVDNSIAPGMISSPMTKAGVPWMSSACGELHIGLQRSVDLGRAHVVLQPVDIEPDRAATFSTRVSLIWPFTAISAR